MTWILKVKIDYTCGVLQGTSSNSQQQSKIKLATFRKSKRREVAIVNLMQAQVEEVVFHVS
jgi:hypothetical protein